MTYEIKILDMKRNPSGVIRQIIWSANNDVTSTHIIHTDLNAINTSDPTFIPFELVTEDKAKEWIEGKLDVSLLISNTSKTHQGLPWK